LAKRLLVLLAIVIAAMFVLSAPLTALAWDDDGKGCAVKCVKVCKDVGKKCPPKDDGKDNGKKCPKVKKPGWGFGDENHKHTGPPGLDGKIK